MLYLSYLFNHKAREEPSQLNAALSNFAYLTMRHKVLKITDQIRDKFLPNTMPLFRYAIPDFCDVINGHSQVIASDMNHKLLSQ
ncbi:hypothetical protein M514_20408 [Trichuris suis]|uniref:Uncharacterized protein n=1 Tax=Trichuris suis TaxID=68888 RepID=A0A085ND26_9BILA|nr:hypothetical protein M514_20408 [Trichuris suis]